MSESSVKPNNFRRCSRCNKTFYSPKACDMHIAMYHKGIGERIYIKKKQIDNELTDGERYLESEIIRAMREEV